jgi:hypothetical protein
MDIGFYSRLLAQLLVPLIAVGGIVWAGGLMRFLARKKLHMMHRMCYQCGTPLFEGIRLENRGGYRFPPGQSIHTLSPCRGDGLEPDHATKVMKNNLRVYRQRVRIQLHLGVFLGKVYRMFFWVLIVCYLPVSSSVLSFFRCVEVGEKWYIAADLSAQCYTPVWNGTLALAIFSILVYGGGIPVFLFVVLRQLRSHGVADRADQLVAMEVDSPIKQQMMLEIRQTMRWAGQLFVPPRTFDEERDLIVKHLQQRNLTLKTNQEKAGFLFEHFRPQVRRRKVISRRWICLSNVCLYV